MLESFDGKSPSVSDHAFVHRSACVRGDVRIGDHSIVLSNVSLIGDNGPVIIGRRCLIEENCVFHVDTFSSWENGTASRLCIGERVIVGHGAVVHAKSIGNRVLIGINASVLEDVEIGDECIIAAGSVIPEGTVIPNRSFVAGVPACIKGEISRNYEQE